METSRPTRRRSMAVLALLLASLSIDAPGQQLYIAGEHSPPAAMSDSTGVIGRETEKIQEIMRRSATPYKLELLPWKRAYTLAQSRTDMCVYSMTRTPEREKLFKWVGPTDEAEWIFYGRADHRFPLKTLEDARTLRIGTYHGDARDAYLRGLGFQTDPVQDEMMNPKKLLMNRIDLWAVSLRAGSNPLGRYDWADVIVPLLVFNRVQVYLACNRAVPDVRIERMNAVLGEMRRDGTFTRLNKKYEHWGAPQ